MTETRFYIGRFLRKLHWIVVLCGLGAAIGISADLLLPASYQSQARLLLERDGILQQIAPQSAPETHAPTLELVRERVLHRDRLTALAKDVGLYDDHFPRPTEDEIVTDMRSRISVVLSSGQSLPTMVTVSFNARDAKLAQDTTDRIAASFLAEDGTARLQRAARSTDFFTRDVARLRAALETQEAQVLAFRERHANALPDSLPPRHARLLAVQEKLALIDRQIGLLDAQRTSDGGHGIPTTLTPDQVQLAQLEKELAGQSTLMSAENPKLRLLTMQADKLRERVRGGANLSGPPLSAGDRADGPKRAELATQKDRLARERDLLAASIEATAANGLKLAQLEHGQNQTRDRFDRAVANLGQAQTGDLIETLGHGPRLTLFEQATLPSRPDGFGMAKLGLAGAAAGALLGAFLIALTETTTARIRRPEDLTAALGIIPFATVPPLKSRPA